MYCGKRRAGCARAEEANERKRPWVGASSVGSWAGSEGEEVCAKFEEVHEYGQDLRGKKRGQDLTVYFLSGVQDATLEEAPTGCKR